MLNWLFKKKQKRLSKIDYRKKWKFFELLDDLHKAEKFLANRRGGYSGKFTSVEEFRHALLDEINRIEFNNENNLKQIYDWFLPNNIWSHFTGKEGLELGNRIFERASRWKNGIENER